MRAQLCEVLHCLPSQLDQEDDARIEEIKVWLMAQRKREQRDRARQQAMIQMNGRGD